MRVDWERFDRGAKQIRVRGVCTTDARREVVEDAIAAIQTDPTAALTARYMGVKNYASFGDQREDHEYGMGPAHGVIVFSVERRRDFKGPLDSDAIYALEVVRDFSVLTDEQVKATGIERWANACDVRAAFLEHVAAMKAIDNVLCSARVDAH